MYRQTYARISATLPNGFSVTWARWNAEAFLVVCFVWGRMPR